MGMKNKILVDVVKSKNLVIPLYLYRLREKLDLTYEEFIVVMYLYNSSNPLLFDINKISDDLGMDTTSLMNLIDTLSGKNIIDFKVIPNEKKVMEEYLSLDNFYERISLLLMDENNQEEDDKNIFSMIEQEFGRTLSPMEYEIVKAWLEGNIKEEIIACALKEATMNGVSNLRYIDKILYEWEKKGLDTKEKVENYLSNYKKKQEKNEKKVDIYDWDEWLDENED